MRRHPPSASTGSPEAASRRAPLPRNTREISDARPLFRQPCSLSSPSGRRVYPPPRNPGARPGSARGRGGSVLEAERELGGARTVGRRSHLARIAERAGVDRSVVGPVVLVVEQVEDLGDGGGLSAIRNRTPWRDERPPCGEPPRAAHSAAPRCRVRCRSPTDRRIARARPGSPRSDRRGSAGSGSLSSRTAGRRSWCRSGSRSHRSTHPRAPRRREADRSRSGATCSSGNRAPAPTRRPGRTCCWGNRTSPGCRRACRR